MADWCVILATVATILSIACTPAGQRLLGSEDPGSFVIDEVAGYFVAASFAGAAVDWREALVALVMFRLFDIAKPPPIRRLEKLGGRLGITVDDLMADIYAGVCVLIMSYTFLR